MSVGKLDVRRSHRGVHNQLPVVLLPAVILLRGGVGILPTFQRLLTAGWLIGIVTVIIVSFFVFCFGNSNFFRYAVVAVYVPAVLRPLAGADIFIDPSNVLHGEALAEMHHHGSVKQRLLRKFMQPEKVLHIGVLLDCRHAALVSQLLRLFDID